MRLFYLFLSNFCKNCIYYNPLPNDITLQSSVCIKFNGKLTDICREDEKKCGQSGKYFELKESKLPERVPVSCKSCKYYDYEYNRCFAFTKKNIVTGIVIYDYAVLCRLDESKCGKYGRLHRPHR